MSLPNPDSVVTEERLSEFYAGIRPYLGGMPDVLANKFNKSDLYSTNEQLIGRWFDGKPLYQKTVDCGNLPNATTKNVAHGISNLGDVIDIRGFATNGTLHIPLPQTQVDQITNQVRIDARATNIEIITGSSAFTSYTAYVTLQYTKTSDAAIYVGSDTDYSTDEKIVGTWIDGKPLYQKSYQTTTPSSNDASTIIDLSSDMIVVNMFGGIVNSDSFIPLNTDKNAYDYGIRTYCDTANNAVKQSVSGDSWKNKAEIVTLQYTKTSS